MLPAVSASSMPAMMAKAKVAVNYAVSESPVSHNETSQREMRRPTRKNCCAYRNISAPRSATVLVNVALF